jgi:hypothetical protein
MNKKLISLSYFPFFFFVRDKIAAEKLDRVLGKADERNGVDARIYDPFYDPLVFNVRTHEDDSHGRSTEWDGLGNPFCNLPAAGVKDLSLECFLIGHFLFEMVLNCFDDNSLPLFARNKLPKVPYCARINDQRLRLPRETQPYK